MPEAIATEPTPTAAATTGEVTEAPQRGLGIVFWVSMLWIALLFFLAIFANVLPIRDPDELGIITREVEPFESPGRNAWFGADAQGKDLFANVVHGARPALILGITVTLIAASIGTTIGIIAGYFRGRTDSVIMASTDIALAFPAIVLLIAVRQKPSGSTQTDFMSVNGWA